MTNCTLSATWTIGCLMSTELGFGVKSGMSIDGFPTSAPTRSAPHGKMPKVKQIKPKGRTANTTRAPPRLVRQEAIDLTDHHDTLLSLTDPFSPSASKAQYPDQGAGRTCTFTQRVAFTQAVDAEGEVALCFNPKINYPVLQSTGVVGNVVTWGVAWS